MRAFCGTVLCRLMMTGHARAQFMGCLPAAGASDKHMHSPVRSEPQWQAAPLAVLSSAALRNVYLEGLMAATLDSVP